MGTMIQKNILKSYAPEARKEFIKAVTERAAFYGIMENKIIPSEVKGDFIFISGRPFPKSIEKKRNDLIAWVERTGFEQTMEEISYTWFNRFMAIRFMEVNGYLSHGYRVLSHPDGHNEPELLEKAQFVEKLDGLEKDEIVKLKTASGKESELYRRLIIAQCNDLNAALPFLFERVDDPTELLLPDNLLNTDSVIRKMTSEIPEDNWKEVEIVGWLYQFYIQERKNKLVKTKKNYKYKTEDIPAVTQLFTPNWIVKYLVQNSLGAKWLATYPKSGIRAKMEYYIPPVEQSDEVNAKLKEITPDALNPEELTIMDPACGSGHILVKAYELLKEIYLERGYRARDIAGLILTKNLFGLEIDDRAAQLACFALVMKAFADDREIFKKGIKPNVICLKSGNGAGAHFKEAQDLIDLFENAKTFGSLIRVPEGLQANLPAITKLLEKKKTGDIFEQKDAEVVEVLLKQAEILSKRYDCILTNPPYIGLGRMNSTLSNFVRGEYANAKNDLFSCFVELSLSLAYENSYLGFVTPFVWMYISSYEVFRKNVIIFNTITSLIKPSYTAFFESAIVPLVTFIMLKNKLNYNGTYIDLEYLGSADEQPKRLLSALESNHNKYTHNAKMQNFCEMPNYIISYQLDIVHINLFQNKNYKLDQYVELTEGIHTRNNDRYLRFWFEINIDKMSTGENIRRKKWVPFNKGGSFRNWYGNNEYVINWENNGYEIINSNKATMGKNSHYFERGITYTSLTSSKNSFRYFDEGFLYDVSGPSIYFHDTHKLKYTLGFLCSKVGDYFIKIINPTLSVQLGDIKKIPMLFDNKNKNIIDELVDSAILLSTKDWDNYEISWDFKRNPLLIFEGENPSVKEILDAFTKHCYENVCRLKVIEEQVSKLFIDLYNLKNRLNYEIPIEMISLKGNPFFKYKKIKNEREKENRFKLDCMKELISYSVGCMMGRYSLDVSGIVYAHVENKGFDSKKYKNFPADEDGIIPITEQEWFDDDAASRFFRFVEVAWDKKGLDENLDFIAEAIGRKSGEPSREVIRRYFMKDFFKDHCQTYKNRPIYWLFTSGIEKAFQALVYLHRYNEGTLARMRTEYVLPLQTKIARHIEHLVKDKDAASGAVANKIQKEITVLQKQQAELAKFDEKLRHYADMKIKIDLDDGVKVNYVKFEELLEPIKGLKYGSEKD